MVECPLSDGCSWSKYGQKDIFGANHPSSPRDIKLGFPKIAQHPETFGDVCGFDGLSSPDKSLSSQTSPDDPDLLNDISDLGNASIFVFL
nr:probable WRKY transcription factor 46 [Tanacetum cinerariifolium]